MGKCQPPNEGFCEKCTWKACCKSSSEQDLKHNEIEETEKAISELWHKGFIPIEELNKIIVGYKLIKEYTFSLYGEVKVLYYKKGKEKLFVVDYMGTPKKITENWKEAESLARQLGQRCKLLYKLFGY